MNMHVDKSGQGEISGELGRRCGLGFGNPRDRTVRDLNGRARAPILHRVDDGDPGQLKSTVGSRWRRPRSPQSKPVENKAVEDTHGKTLRIGGNMNMSKYSY